MTSDQQHGSQPPQPGEQSPYGQPPAVEPDTSPQAGQQPQQPPQQPGYAQQQPQQQYPQYQQQPGQQYQQQAYGQYQQPYGQYQQPYGQYQQAYGQPYGYVRPAYPIEPSNDSAVASIITSLCAIGFLVITSGLLAPLTLAASIVGIVLGRKGMKNVDEGRTRKQRDMAQGGFVAGIIGTVLSVLAIVVWVLIIVFAINETDVGSGQLDAFLL